MVRCWLNGSSGLTKELGCTDIRVKIIAINGKQLVLSDGQTIDLTNEIEIEGQLQVSAVVIIRLCVRADGTIVDRQYRRDLDTATTAAATSAIACAVWWRAGDDLSLSGRQQEQRAHSQRGSSGGQGSPGAR